LEDLKAYKQLFCAFLTKLGDFFGLIAVRKIVKRLTPKNLPNIYYKELKIFTNKKRAT